MNSIRTLRRAFVDSLNAVLPHTPFGDRLVGLPGFYSRHRRLPRRPDHPQAWISDILFSRACLDDWTPLQRRCVDKATAVDVARAAAPELRFARRHAVIDVPEGASLPDLQRLLAPFMGQPLVAKPAHSCGGILFLDQSPTPAQWSTFHQRATRDYYTIGRERQYRGLPRRIIIEERVGKIGEPFTDYKLYCTAGKVHAICLVVDNVEASAYTFRYFRLPEFEPIPYELPVPLSVATGKKHPLLPADMPRPRWLDEMSEIAAALSAPFDHVRIDFYDGHDGPYFSEYTFTQNGGRSPCPARELSEELVQRLRMHSTA